MKKDFRPVDKAVGNTEAGVPPGAVDHTDYTLEWEAGLIGVSQYVKELRSFVTGQALRQQPVLLYGEQGLRPEQVARAIHQAGGKPADSFHAVDGRPYNETELYELLFAPTGLVENCQGGTIFMDEAAGLALPLLYQMAVPVERLQLRSRYNAVIGVRLVLAVSERAAEQPMSNTFYTQLLATLQPAVFRLRPLRERSEDIPYLVSYLAGHVARRLGKGRHTIPTGTMMLLTAYAWQGNIDELEAVLESMIAHTPPPEVSEALLPPRIRQAQVWNIPEGGVNLFEAVERYEGGLIAQALRQTGGKQNAAAQLLGIRPQTLNAKLKRYQDANVHESN